MARTIPKQTRTPADELRDLLDTCYKIAVNSQDASPETLHALLHNLDRIQELFPLLEAQGVDLRPERVKWQEVQGAVRRHQHELITGLRPLGGLKNLRTERPDPPDRETHWWWWLDEIRAAAKRKQLMTVLIIVTGFALLVAIGIFAFQKFLPVDEDIAAAYDHKLNAENYVVTGELDNAITELEAARELTPDDPDILSLLAALYDRTNQSQKAAATIDELNAHYPADIVLSSLAQSYLAVGEVEKAQDLALQAIDVAPANPQGYLVAGMAYEAKGDVRQAMNYYQTAAEKANAAGDFQTEAFAKVRLANILQKPQITLTP